MVLFKFAEYNWACRNIPSLPTCNLFFHQLLKNPKGMEAPATELLGLPNVSSPEYHQALENMGVGVNPACAIPRMHAAGGEVGSVGNVPNIVMCGLSVLVAILLASLAGRRVAAVARLEFRWLFFLYGVVQVFQLLDTGAFLRAGTPALVWISSVHLGLVVVLFWTLLWIAFLSLQIVEDGTLMSFIPMLTGSVILLVGCTYIFLDTGFQVTTYFLSNNPATLHSIWLFVLTIIWPAAAAFMFYVLQIGVVALVLKEIKPLLIFTASLIAFILSQGCYYFLSYQICKGGKRKIDGSFIATLLETITVILIYYGWTTMTEDDWVSNSEEADDYASENDYNGYNNGYNSGYNNGYNNGESNPRMEQPQYLQNAPASTAAYNPAYDTDNYHPRIERYNAGY